MYSLDDVRHLHLEITTRCNAGCPMCPRHYNFTSITNEAIGDVDMNLALAKKVLQPNLLKQIKIINFCGNYGDAITNRDFIPIVKYIKSINPNIWIILTTNGGARDEKFWIDVAHLVDKCSFGIDGLKDTNHLYRQFVNWNILERNVKTYVSESIKLGKKDHSSWTMNVFRHNKHQVDDAEKLSKEWGVSHFIQRLTDRFSTMTKDGLSNWPVYDKNLNLTHVIHPLDSEDDSINSRFVQKTIEWTKKTYDTNIRYEIPKSDYEELENRYGNDKINCKVKSEKSIYIDYKGRLFPCCFIGAAINRCGSAMGQQLMQMYDQFGDNFNNLGENNIEDIFDSGIFEELEISWYKKNISCGRTAVCVSRCGIKAPESKYEELR